MSLMFNISSMIIVLNVCVFQSLCFPVCDDMLRHIMYDHRSPCLCIGEINSLSLMFDISTIIIVIYVCVLQR